MFNRTLNALLNLLLPHHCFGCQERGTVLCERCANERELADPLDNLNTHAPFAYRDPVIRRMIWALKYRGGQTIGMALGGRLYDYLLEELAGASEFDGNDPNFLIIPIPLTRARTRERGFNQAVTIARGLVRRNLARRNGTSNFIIAENILRRTRDTGSQTVIKARAKRLANMRHAFAVIDPVIVRGKQIIVVDDVITTGGTMNDARRALEAAGAKIVLAVAVAHG